jgi:hypothetical protein
MLDFAAFGGSVTLVENHGFQSGQIVAGLIFWPASSLFVHHAKPKLARLAERETGFLLHCLTLYDCRTEVIIMRKPSKLCMLDRRGIYSQPSLWALATLSRRMSRLNSPLALSYRSEMFKSSLFYCLFSNVYYVTALLPFDRTVCLQVLF